MRKLILSILLAGVAVSPALAQDRGSRDDRDTVKAERQQAHEERGQTRAQTQPVQQAQPVQQVQQAQPNRTQQFEARQQRQAQGASGGFDRSRSDRGNRGTFDGQQQPQQQPPQQQLQGRSGFDRSQTETRQQGQSYQGQRYQGQRYQGQRYQGQGVQSQSYQGQSYQGQRQSYQGQSYQGQRYQGQQSAGNWDRNWRNNQRYDWRRYRDSHRSTFRLGIYYDPFGYGYRSFDIGYRLQPNYFGQQYWIDPAMYELPFPPPGTQWVRYWNDALLVDMYSGEVVDVIHNFFW
jgi:Ni/Co efflux regulator RcnB